MQRTFKFRQPHTIGEQGELRASRTYESGSKESHLPAPRLTGIRLVNTGTNSGRGNECYLKESAF